VVNWDQRSSRFWSQNLSPTFISFIICLSNYWPLIISIFWILMASKSFLFVAASKTIATTCCNDSSSFLALALVIGPPNPCKDSSIGVCTWAWAWMSSSTTGSSWSIQWVSWFLQGVGIVWLIVNWTINWYSGTFFA